MAVLKMLAIAWVLLALALSIAQLVLAPGGGPPAPCESNLTFATWLTVQGVVGLVVYAVVFVLIVATDSAFVIPKHRAAWFFHLCVLGFRLAWLLVGAVMFWHTCSPESASLTCLMWVSLLFGAVLLFGSFYITFRSPQPAAP